MFPPCNRERSHKDNPTGADAQVLRETCFHRQPQKKTAQLHMYIQQTMIQETQRCDQTTWIQKREIRRPLEVHSPETQNCRSHLAVTDSTNQNATSTPVICHRSHYATKMVTMEAYHNDHPNSGQVWFAVKTTMHGI